MANSVSHAALPYPIKGARFTCGLQYFDTSGIPTNPTTPDTEVSIDGGAYADCIEEVTVVGSVGQGYITFTGDETNGSIVQVAAKCASGPNTSLVELHPAVLPVIHSGTAQAGTSSSITLASGAADNDASAYLGCFVMTTGGTGGGGGSGSRNNQVRRITGYNTSTKVASVTPNWETAPDGTTTYQVLRPENIGTAQANITAINGTTADAALFHYFLNTATYGVVSTANIAGSATHFRLSNITEATAQHFYGKQVWVVTNAGALQYWGTVLTSSLISGEQDITVSLGSAAADVLSNGTIVFLV